MVLILRALNQFFLVWILFIKLFCESVIYCREDSLQSHIEFLETQGIAGVSHHSLLFSKTAPPLPEVDAEQEEVER